MVQKLVFTSFVALPTGYCILCTTKKLSSFQRTRVIISRVTTFIYNTLTCIASPGTCFIPLHNNGCARRLLPTTNTSAASEGSSRRYSCLPSPAPLICRLLSVDSVQSLLFPFITVPYRYFMQGTADCQVQKSFRQHFPKICRPVSSDHFYSVLRIHSSLQKRRRKFWHMAVVYQAVPMAFPVFEFWFCFPVRITEIQPKSHFVNPNHSRFIFHMSAKNLQWIHSVY